MTFRVASTRSTRRGDEHKTGNTQPLVIINHAMHDSKHNTAQSLSLSHSLPPSLSLSLSLSLSISNPSPHLSSLIPTNISNRVYQMLVMVYEYIQVEKGHSQTGGKNRDHKNIEKAV